MYSVVQSRIYNLYLNAQKICGDQWEFLETKKKPEVLELFYVLYLEL